MEDFYLKMPSSKRNLNLRKKTSLSKCTERRETAVLACYQRRCLGAVCVSGLTGQETTSKFLYFRGRIITEYEKQSILVSARVKTFREIFRIE